MTAEPLPPADPAGDDSFDAFLKRAKRGGTGLVAAGILIFAASLVFSYVRLKQVESEIVANRAIIEEQVATLRAQEAEIERNEQRLASLTPAALRGFGMEREPVADRDVERAVVRTSLGAHDALTELARTHRHVAEGQTVVYYAKSPTIDANQENFVASLRELGFTVRVVRPVNPASASNALWFGEDVDPVAVRMAGYALIRAGYDLQQVAPFRDPGGPKSGLIEIGVSPQAAGRPVITTDALARVLERVP